MEKLREGILFVIILSIGLINAVSVSDSSIILDANHTSKIITFSQTSSNTTTITFTLDSSISDKVDLSLSQLSILNSGTLTISLKSGLSNGVYVGNLNWNANDGSSGFIPIAISVNNPTQETGCRLNPSIVSYTQTVQQNTEFELPKITFNPSPECQGTFSIQSAYVTGGVQTSSGQKPVFIKSAGNNEITLGVNTEGLSSRTYNTKLTVTAFGKTFQEVSDINVIVTTGTDPGDSCSLNNLPVCSVSKNIINLNTTASLICTNLGPDLTVIPQSDDKYIIGVSVETPTGQYIWNFKGINYVTETEIKANFYCKNSPIGSPFSQKVKILSTGTSAGGTTLDFLFTPSLDKIKPNQEFIIQLIDNSSGSLASESELFIDAIKQNNSDGYSFKTSFEYGKTYLLRGLSPGYENVIKDFSLSSKEMDISIIPESGDSNTDFNITTPNATILIDGNKLADNFYFGKLSEGEHKLTFISEGYYDKEINITVANGLYASLGSEWKKGVEQLIFLSRNSTWILYYSKDSESNQTILGEGNSSQVIFTPEKNGIYRIYSGENLIFNNELKGTSVNTIWYIVGIVALIGVMFFIFKKSKSKSTMPQLAGAIQY